ncbi:hypothetical protein D3C80_978100 [compost metagenome]
MDHAIPVVFTQRRESAIAGNTGIVHHAIIGAVGFNILLQHLTALAAMADIKLNQPPLPAGADNLLQCVFGPGLIAVVVNGYQKAIGSQAAGNSLTDPFTGAGD